MSYKLLYRLRSVGGIPGPEKSVLRFLAEISENHETAWHPVEQLAFQTGFSVRTVQRALRSLECRGILILIGGKKGRGSTPIYRINLDAASPVTPPPVEDVPLVTEPLSPTNGTTRARRNDLVGLFSKEKQEGTNTWQPPASRAKGNTP